MYIFKMNRKTRLKLEKIERRYDFTVVTAICKGVCTLQNEQNERIPQYLFNIEHNKL